MVSRPTPPATGCRTTASRRLLKTGKRACGSALFRGWGGSRTGRLPLYTTRDGLPGNDISVIRECRDGSLWVSSTGGINLLREGALTTFAIPFDQAENVINDILEDREGNLWLGTGVSGIMRLKKRQLTVFAKE